ncbi:hypothetical protein GCM10017687_09610 [Streptomyces echinatus]
MRPKTELIPVMPARATSRGLRTKKVRPSRTVIPAHAGAFRGSAGGSCAAPGAGRRNGTTDATNRNDSPLAA